MNHGKHGNHAMKHDDHAKKHGRHHGMIMTMFRHDHGIENHVFPTRVVWTTQIVKILVSYWVPRPSAVLERRARSLET